jgi:hypothetical protein
MMEERFYWYFKTCDTEGGEANENQTIRNFSPDLNDDPGAGGGKLR